MPCSITDNSKSEMLVRTARAFVNQPRGAQQATLLTQAERKALFAAATALNSSASGTTVNYPTSDTELLTSAVGKLRNGVKISFLVWLLNKLKSPIILVIKHFGYIQSAALVEHLKTIRLPVDAPAKQSASVPGRSSCPSPVSAEGSSERSSPHLPLHENGSFPAPIPSLQGSTTPVGQESGSATPTAASEDVNAHEEQKESLDELEDRVFTYHLLGGSDPTLKGEVAEALEAFDAFVHSRLRMAEHQGRKVYAQICALKEAMQAYQGEEVRLEQIKKKANDLRNYCASVGLTDLPRRVKAELHEASGNRLFEESELGASPADSGLEGDFLDGEALFERLEDWTLELYLLGGTDKGLEQRIALSREAFQKWLSSRLEEAEQEGAEIHAQITALEKCMQQCQQEPTDALKADIYTRLKTLADSCSQVGLDELPESVKARLQQLSL